MFQIFTLIITAASGSHEKFDIYGKPKCCSGSLSPSYQKLQPWTASLRAATYQSLISHLDFPGSLDGRLDRDEKLWNYLQEAEFVTDTNGSFDDLFEDTATGVLIERPQNNQRSTFEFQQTDKFDYECPNNNCHSLNNSLLALWRVRKSDSPNSMWIRVKLPKIINTTPMEDMYYYSAKYGLKKLSPDPPELNHFKRHRFSTSQKNKGEFKYLDRMDFRFPNFKNIYGTGRVTPSSFMYDSPVFPESEEDDWYGSLRKPYSEDTFGHQHHHSSYYSASRPHSRPHEYDHFSHIHPSIPPSQELDHPSQEVRGFMPSVGPISAPPPYRTEYAYDPRYLMYYTNQQNRQLQHTTVPPKYFKPSTEFVRYSEIDPFFHPDGEAEIEQTSPMPQDIAKPMQQFPSSTMKQIPPTNPFPDNQKPFQIIVENMNSQSHKLSKPTLDENFSTRRQPSTTKLLPAKQHTVTERPEFEEEVSVRAFGEKIKPKTTTTTKPTFKMIPQVTVDYKTPATEVINDEDDQAMAIEKPQNNLSSTVGSKLTNQDDKNPNLETEFIMNSTQSLDSTLTTEALTESTNSDDFDKTSNSNFETTENIVDANKMFELNSQTTISGDEFDNLSEKLIEEVSTTPNSTVSSDKDTTAQTEIDSTTTDDQTEKTTVIDKETTTDTTNETDDTDFFSSLANLFSTDSATTEMTTDEATTESITKQPPVPDPDTQESRHQNINYRLLTFPGDPVSIVSNRISKSVSYRTATGKERKLHGKQLLLNRHRFSSVYKDYSKI